MLRRTALLGTALSVVLSALLGLTDLPARAVGVTPVHTLAGSEVWADGSPEVLVDSRGWTTAVWTKDPGVGAMSVWSATKRPRSAVLVGDRALARRFVVGVPVHGGGPGRHVVGDVGAQRRR